MPATCVAEKFNQPLVASIFTARQDTGLGGPFFVVLTQIDESW